MTARKTTKTATVVDFKEEAKAQHDHVAREQAEQPLEEQQQQTFREMMAEAGIFIPTWKRALISFIVGSVGGYLLGDFLFAVTNVLMLATLAATASTFLMWCVGVIGFILSLYLSFKLGAKVTSYIATSSIDEDFGNAWNWVKSKFTSDAPKLA